MENQEKLTDFLKENLYNGEAKIKSDEWVRLKKKLKRKNFFKFSLYHLNIYYLMLILGSLSSGFVLFNQNLSYQDTDKDSSPKETVSPAEKIDDLPTIEDQYHDMEQISNTKETDKTNEEIETTTRDNNLTMKGRSEVSIAGSKDSISLDNKINDSITRNESSTNTNIIKKEKTIYVLEQDTIIKYDTVRVVNRKKRFNFK